MKQERAVKLFLPLLMVAIATQAFHLSVWPSPAGRLLHYSVPPSRPHGITIFGTSNGDDDDENDELILDGAVLEQQLASLRSKFPTSEAAYLAASKARAAAKTQSTGRAATDADWQALAKEQAQKSDKSDDWESSAEEADNVDSQILLPSIDEDDGNDNEPKLLLF